MTTKLPSLMPANSIGIQITGADSRFELRLTDIDRWPNRGEIKQIGKDRRLYLYNGDRLLLDAPCYVAGLPDVFGLSFKRVVGSYVDFKSKIQNITAIFTTYDILNSVETMHEMTGYNE